MSDENKQEVSPAKHGSVLVLGGGISGIQSALDLADSGFKVYLVDKGLSIGGTMTQLDKTFPTNDCSMCILAPKLVYAGRHPNIEIITNAELIKLEGEKGDFHASISKHPRFVDLEKCNGCGDCVEHCPVSIVSSFDEQLSMQKAIYQPFPQAIPNAFAIQKDTGVSPCKIACPADLNVQGFIALASQKKFAEAYELIKEKIPLPGSLGRICYHPCETECNRKEIDDPLAICRIRRFIADYIYDHPEELKQYYKQRDEKLSKKENVTPPINRGKGKKVAIIGSGPAGLTCAYDLAKLGYKPVIFEANKKNGGMLFYGVPEYRLPKQYLDKEINVICSEQGIEIKNNQVFGKHFTITDLTKQGYESVFIAIGAHQGKTVSLSCFPDGENHLVDGISYLHNLNKGKIPKDHFKNKKILVIGGGNVAMDSARTALRLGGNVTVVYRRTIQEMPANCEEIRQAEEEGVRFSYLSNPRELIKKDNSVYLKCQQMRLGPADESGRRSPEPVKDSFIDMSCDIVLFAIGQNVKTNCLKENKIKLTQNNLIDVDTVTYQTNIKGVFAGGDAVSGPASAVEAIGMGHEAAISIDRYLHSEDLKQDRIKPECKSADIPKQASRFPLPLQLPEMTLAKKRINSFDEIDLGYTLEKAVKESQRCLNCSGCCECLQCELNCARDAICHEMKEEIVDIDIGSVILSPGFEEYIPPKADSLGYRVYPNVLTSIEFERMLSASGPFQGHIQRISDKKSPKKIAWLQCIGSRDESCDNKYCSSVCCMYATKEAVLAKEHQPGVDTHIYFIDMRSFGKDFERYYKRAENEYGVEYRRCKIPRIEQDRTTKNLIIRYVNEQGNIQNEEYDMIVLSVGLQPCSQLDNLSKILQINLNEYGFVQTDPYYPTLTTREGVYASGTVTEPKDIPESVTQASAAAADAAKDICSARGSEIIEKIYPEEIDTTNETPKVGVFLCHCGINIGSIIDIKQVLEQTKKLSHVVYSDDSTFSCSQDSLEKIKEKIKQYNLNRIVVASCTPRTHEPLFQDTLKESGLNAHLFEMANLRDQNSWVHKNNAAAATQKAIDSVRMAVAKAINLKPVYNQKVSVVKNALVVGGGIAGMTAALSIADQGFHVFLIEKEHQLGGHLSHIYLGVKDENPQKLLKETILKVEKHPNITLYTNSTIDTVSGYVGNYITVINTDKTTKEIEHGVIVVATGAKPYTPHEYQYDKSENIITQTDLEKQIYKKEASLKKVKELVMIQCVGSRNDEHPYCSRVCCSEAVKNALSFKAVNPDASVYILYRDMRTYGFREDRLYREARKKGILFIRFNEKEEPTIKLENNTITLTTTDYILGRTVVLHPDKLVLSVGIVPENNQILAQQLKVPLTADSFYSEAHVKLRPIDFSADGLFLCGLAHSPRFIEESILQAQATASRASTILSQEFLLSKGTIAYIRNRNCVGCKQCIEICPYDAISFDEEKQLAVVNEILCQGCGACATICPSGTTQQNTFTKKQLVSMIDACLE
jgi:heterodisulfide reductase subunit A-like polyferredoxin